MGDVPSRFVRAPTTREGEELARLRRKPSAPVRVRAEIVQLSARGVPVPEPVRRVGVSRTTVTTWLRRFEIAGSGGLRTRAQSGRPPTLAL